MKNCYLFLFILVAPFATYAQQPIRVQHKPVSIFIERGEHNQHLNFDFKIANLSSDTLTLTRIGLSAYTTGGQLFYQHFLDNNGTAPSIEIIPKREFRYFIDYNCINRRTSTSIKNSISKNIRCTCIC